MKVILTTLMTQLPNTLVVLSDDPCFIYRSIS